MPMTFEDLRSELPSRGWCRVTTASTRPWTTTVTQPVAEVVRALRMRSRRR
ncbi:hypothetical protein [Nocardia sp. NPDC049707]|uniref:hypothetical protein n=1 Tax=Nocardia sp. NPDC049707 TaxID=3154735 RepID=UPI00342DDAC8